MSKSFYFTALLLLFFADNVVANNHTHRTDEHAPIGVMRDHVHKKGETMLSYRYSHVKMSGLRNSDSNVSSDAALTERNIVPLNMRMRMDMFSAMYGLTDRMTVALMGTVIGKEMSHQKRNGDKFNRESEGVGDTKVSTLYQFYNDGNDKFLFNMGLSLPTGSSDRHFSGSRLPYPMQIGSGSYEALPGLSYTALRDGYSFGGQFNASFKINSNNNGYKLGDSYNATSWISKAINNSLSISTRLDYHKIEAIEGRDSSLNPAMIVAADASVQDRQYLDALIGVNYLIPDSVIRGFRVAFEVGAPIYQRFDDNMLETDYKAVIGLQKTF